MNRVYKKITQIFSLDLRSLALARICAGMIIIVDLIYRLQDYRAHYTDLGVFPRSAYLEMGGKKLYWSLFLLSDGGLYHAILFCAMFLAAFFLLIGYQTRLATIASWILVTSLQNRNPALLNSGDEIFRLMLFWGMFLPLGAYYSLDKIYAPEKIIPKQIFSIATMCFVLQLIYLYVFTGILKIGPEWLGEGNAIYLALNYDQMARPPAVFLRQFPDLLRVFTYATIFLELCGPFLFIMPWRHSLMRVVGIGCFLSLHAGIQTCLVTGIFQFAMAVYLIALLPSYFWDDILANFLKHKKINFYQNFLKRVARLPFPKSSLRIDTPYLFYPFLAFLSLYVLFWNIGTAEASVKKLIRPTRSLAHLLRIDQSWVMFKTGTSRNDGWLVIPATLNNGQVVDLYKKGKALSWEKPDFIGSTYKNQRWRKLLRRATGGYRKKRPYGRYYGEYLVREWNRRHDESEQIDKCAIYYMRERTLGVDNIDAPNKILIWSNK